MIQPNMSRHKYSGTAAMMLNIASRNNGYEVPVFINLATMDAKGIRIKEVSITILRRFSEKKLRIYEGIFVILLMALSFE